VRERRFKRRLFWTAVLLGLLLIWLIAQVLLAAQAMAAAARGAWRHARHGEIASAP
jgi:hypothetical protein